MSVIFGAPPVARAGARVILATLALALAACGAEVAGTAATVGKLQAEQVRQAQAQKEQIVEAMKKAQEAGVQRAADAASGVQ